MQTDKTSDITTAAEQAGVAAPKSSSRRRLLQAGIGASPVLLTVMSRPVLAFGVDVPPCRSPSALASFQANALTSRAPGSVCIDNMGPAGMKRAYDNSATTSTPPYLANFGGQPFVGLYTMLVPSSETRALPLRSTWTNTDSPTLRQVIRFAAGTGERDLLARNVAAAELNRLGGVTPKEVLSAQNLSDIWATVGSVGGANYPVPGVPGGGWNIIQVNAYLRSTWFGKT